MRAVGFVTPSQELSGASFGSYDLPDPITTGGDLLIEVKAASVNPVDYKERGHRRPVDQNRPVILGYDGAGVVSAVGKDVVGFKPGERVFWSGELTRDGSNATHQLVDHRLVARMPSSLGFVHAAALPLTGITAYEALFERMKVPQKGAGKVLVIGGAGGVGSIAIQLLKKLTDSEVYATAGRQESREWVEKMGADVIVGRDELVSKAAGGALPEFNYVLCTTNAESYLSLFPEIIAPLGTLGLIDDPRNFDVVDFKRKGITTAWELIFTKTLYKCGIETQGAILDKISQLVDSGEIVSTLKTIYEGLSPETLEKVHRQQQTGSVIGKLGIMYE